MQTSVLETRTIRISEKTYRDLAKRGTLADTFDTVIQRLLTSIPSVENEKNGDTAEKGFGPKPAFSIHSRSALESDPRYE
jgi:uncharacterized protein YccT (UPF0319 family)